MDKTFISINPPIINWTATNKMTTKPTYPTHWFSLIYFAKYEAAAPIKTTDNNRPKINKN